MSTMTALARAHAMATGQAQRITTVRHAHVGARPLMCVPLALAGEANAPLAVMVGDRRDRPQLMVVHQPRDRDQRFAFAHSFGQLFLRYLVSFSTVTEQGSRESVGTVEGPQVWVPSKAGVEFLRLLGRSTRFRSVDGPFPVGPAVPKLGRWLTRLTDRADIPGSSVLLAATEVLGQHWATGQSSVEDAHLAALMAWIDPPAGMTGPEAALAAEDPVLHPPAGPATDPGFDREVLKPRIDAYDAARSPAERRRAAAALEAALRGQLAPTWDLMWRAVELVRQLPAGGHVAGRWRRDVEDCRDHYAYVLDGGHPQPKRDNAVNAARRLNDLERAKASYDAQRAFDDRLVMAEYRLAGEAFVGTVTEVDTDHYSPSGKTARPHIAVLTEDPVKLVTGTVRNPARLAQDAEILSVEVVPAGTIVKLELARGMGNGKTPRPGTVPVVGDRVCYSTLSDGYQPRTDFPGKDETPWTHGGPPPGSAPVPTDAGEDWS